MTTPEFGSIPPSPASDWFQFDITNQIGTVHPDAIVQSCQWMCSLSPENDLSVNDPDLAGHIIDDDFTNTTVSVLAGNFIDSITYTLTAQIQLSDNRTLIRFADLLCALRPDPLDADNLPPLSVETFRAAFPAFSDPTLYPSEQIDFWINQALINPPINRWRIGQFYDQAILFWIAHNLTLERYVANMSIAGQPAMGVGVPASKSVNGVSLSYDTGISADPQAGPYNLTIYGQRFWMYLKMAGAAGSEVPTGYPAGTVFNGLGTIMPYALGYSW